MCGAVSSDCHGGVEQSRVGVVCMEQQWKEVRDIAWSALARRRNTGGAVSYMCWDLKN